MNPALLALFTRTVREDMRSKATFWVKGGVGVFVLLVVMIFSIIGSIGRSSTPGRDFFATIVVLQMVSISLIGLSYFGSAVTEEKEEQTIGLLRMTDLNPLSILLGKSTSRLCGALLLLAAMFPFTVLAVTLGGISLGQIGASYLTIAAYTFLLCNVALLGSVLARHTTGAAIFTVAVMSLMLAGAPLLHWIGLSPLGQKLPGVFQAAGHWMWEATAIARLLEVLETGFNGSPVGWQVASNVGLGVFFFLLAWAAFGRFCDQRSMEGGASGPVSRPPIGVRMGRPPRPTKDALTWKDYHFLCGGRMGMIMRSTVYGIALVLVVVGAMSETIMGLGTVTGTFFGVVPLIFSFELAAMGARLFRTEINEQTLSPLAALPLTMGEIAWRKARACLIAAAPGAVTVVVGGLIVALEMRGGGLIAGMGIMAAAQTVGGWFNTFLMMHVAVWLSLMLKRGAVPLSWVLTHVVLAFISGIFMMFLSMISLAASSTLSNLSVLPMAVAPLCTSVLCLVFAMFLRRTIPRQLERLAGEN